VIPFTWLSELGELAALCPVEFATINNNTADSSTVATNPFSSTVHDDIRTKINRADDVASGTKGVVDNQGNTVVMSHFGKFRNRSDVVLGIADALDVDGLGFGINGLGEGFWLVIWNEFDGDAVFLEEDFELVVGSSIQVGPIGELDCQSSCADTDEGRLLLHTSTQYYHRLLRW
jgi:hypothetical protein